MAPLRGARWLLALLLVTSYPLATVLPQSFGWENGAVENAQILVLLLGFAHALWIWRGSKGAGDANDAVGRRLAAVAMPFWLLCAVRETSWGATFLTTAVSTPDGPYYTSRLLWYQPVILPAVLIVVAGMAIAFFRWRLAAPLRELIRRGRFPSWEIGLAVLAAVLSVTAEGKLHVKLPGSDVMLAVLEEWAELLCYAGLILAQARIFEALRNRPRS